MDLRTDTGPQERQPLRTASRGKELTLMAWLGTRGLFLISAIRVVLYRAKLLQINFKFHFKFSNDYVSYIKYHDEK